MKTLEKNRYPWERDKIITQQYHRLPRRRDRCLNLYLKNEKGTSLKMMS